jgi:hypothetical protein
MSAKPASGGEAELGTERPNLSFEQAAAGTEGSHYALSLSLP